MNDVLGISGLESVYEDELRGKDGVETEIQVGQMRQTLGKPGFGRLFYKR